MTDHKRRHKAETKRAKALIKHQKKRIRSYMANKELDDQLRFNYIETAASIAKMAARYMQGSVTTYYDHDSMIKLNKEAGNHWFSASTLAYFKCKLLGCVVSGPEGVFFALGLTRFQAVHTLRRTLALDPVECQNHVDLDCSAEGACSSEPRNPHSMNGVALCGRRPEELDS